MYTKKEEMKWICPRCGQVQKTEVYTAVSIEEEPQLKQKILDASLFEMNCSSCGQKEYHTGPLVYVDEGKKMMLAMSDSSQFDLIKENYQTFGYTVRQVPEIVNLNEKIIIAEENLDDRIVELMKAANTVMLKGEDYDQMLYAPDEDAAYFELIKNAASAGRIPFLQIMYDDMQERFAEELQKRCSEDTIIDLAWAAHFFETYYQPAM